MNLGMKYMPSAVQNQSSQISIQQLLSNPLPERCHHLSNLFQEISSKELQAAFPLVVEHIFGIGNNSGWGLKSIFRSYYPREFDSIRGFLAPEGPLFSAVYRLLSDVHARFEFTVSNLPISTQNMFEEGAVSSLYSNKVPYHGPNRSITHVLLNSFEYFFFHFAYYVVNPNHQKPAFPPANGTDILYSTLLEDYLRYFLPTNSEKVSSISFLAHTSLPIMTSFAPHYSSSMLPSQSPSLNYSNMMSSSANPPTHISPSLHYTSPSHAMLKKTSALLKTLPNISLSPISGISTSSSGVPDQARYEIWRTEIIVMIFVEFWLSLGGAESRKTFFTFGTPGYSMARLPLDRRLSLVSTMLSDSYAPSHENMKIVRIFVKHLHYFSNSSKLWLKSSRNLSDQQMPLDEFKTNVISHLVQKKLYCFLRLSFERWPLDATFRLPLETWLSYIQPWRYINNYGERQTINNETDESDKEFDPTWQRFVTENLLFYTVIFQHLLPRFFRMDLTSTKNSYMLFRVTKVFSQQHLNTMIEEAERTLQGLAPSSLSTFSSRLSNLTPPCPTHTPTVAGTLRQHIAELEGPGFIYTPLFSSAVRKNVTELIQRIAEAQSVVQNILKESESKKRGWFTDLVASIFLSDVFYPSDDYSAADCERVILYLQYSASHLCYLLGINEELIRSDVRSISSASDKSCTGPDYGLDRHGLHLTPLGRHQLMSRICKANVEYRGNPDLQPIRSYELAFLVRLLYHLSSNLNEKYALEIGSLYSRRDWLGKLSRQVLASPMICSKLEKNWTMTSFKWKEEVLPPRISLRILAHKQLIGYILGMYFFAYVFGYGPFTYLLFLGTMFFMYIVVRAALSKTECDSL